MACTGKYAAVSADSVLVGLVVRWGFQERV